MRKIILLLSVLLFSAAANFAQIKIRSGGAGKISVVKGKLRSTIDLSGEIAGCAGVGGAAKRDLDQKGCAASPARFKLIDSVVKNNQTFLVVSSEAAGNCNVCGQCGATEAFAVIWLKLSSSLRVLKKQSSPIENCRLDVALISPYLDTDENTQNETLRLPFKNNVLSVDFETSHFGANDTTTYEFSHLEYNRQSPEKGLVIKTEKREKSSVKNQ